MRRQPFILLSFSSSKKARKAQETQSYQRFQCIDHTAFNTSGTNGPRSLSRVKVGTHSVLLKESHTAAHRVNQGCFGRGWYHYPRTVSHVSETLRGQGAERRTLPPLGLGRVCSRRTQKACGTAMRLCASLFRRRRGPAGLRDLFRFCRSCGLYTLRSVLSECARRGVVSLPPACSVCC